MKSCPTCNRTYPDDTLAFCLIDGSVLSAPYDARTEQPRGNDWEEQGPNHVRPNQLGVIRDAGR